MKTRSFLVTGANKGIGFALVKRILAEIDNSFVFLGSRNKMKGKNALNLLLKDKPNLKDRVRILDIDVSEMSRIQAAKVEVEKHLLENTENGPLLEGIVNNAGVFGDSSMKTMLKVNVQGVYDVTTVFSSIIKENGRVVNVSSMLGPAFVRQCNRKWQEFLLNPKVHWNEIQSIMEIIIQEFDSKDTKNTKLIEMGVKEENISQRTAYELSKALCNSVTMIQAKHYVNLKINSCMPGFIFTDMTSHYADGNKKKAAQMGMKSTKEGTIAPFYLLCDPSVQTTGKYYTEDAKVGSML